MQKNRKELRNEIGVLLFRALIIVLVLIGEITCIVKAVKCNWNPVGKAEIIYTVSAVSGLGAVVGYINIKDN